VGSDLAECYEICAYFNEKIKERDPESARRYLWRCRSKCRKRGVPQIPVIKLFRKRRKEKREEFRSLRI